jgi:hypothetical protein
MKYYLQKAAGNGCEDLTAKLFSTAHEHGHKVGKLIFDGVGGHAL